MSTKNVGQVAGLWIGTTAPSNHNIIWYDSTLSVQKHKVYDTSLSSWVILDSSSIISITYAELRTLAIGTGLSYGAWYLITDKGNLLALAITATKVQYTDVSNNFVIDDLSASATYVISSSNLLIDDISGVWDTSLNKLNYSFTETSSSSEETSDDYLFGKKQRSSVWSLAKYKLSTLVSTLAGNSIIWSKGIFFNFSSAIANIMNVTGGIVGKDAYEADKNTMNQSITTIANNNTTILNSAKTYTNSEVTDAKIYGKKLPSAPTTGTPIDIAINDTLLTIINKIQRWITAFKYANNIYVSTTFTPTSQATAINNNDTVDTALRKVQKNINVLNDKTGEEINSASTPIIESTIEPSETHILMTDTIKLAFIKLTYWCWHIITDRIVDSAVTTAKIADNAITTIKVANSSITSAKIDNDGIIPTGVFRIAFSSVVDLDGILFGSCALLGTNPLFSFDSAYPNNPYNISQSYSPNIQFLSFSPLTNALAANSHIVNGSTSYEYFLANTMLYRIGSNLTIQVIIQLTSTKQTALRTAGYQSMKVSFSNLTVYGSSITPPSDVTSSIEGNRIFIYNISVGSVNTFGLQPHIFMDILLTFIAPITT